MYGVGHYSNYEYEAIRLIPGDVVLAKKHGNVVSEIISGYKTSKFSHVMPVLDSNRLVSAEWPRVVFRSIYDFCNEDYRIKIIRPTVELTREDVRKWCAAGEEAVNKKYDLYSFIGHILNKVGFQKNSMFNCAEVTLRCFNSINRYVSIPFDFVSPHTFEVMSYTNDFITVFSADVMSASFRKIFV